MKRFRSNNERQQICHALPLPDVLKRRREMAARGAKKPKKRARGAIAREWATPQPGEVVLRPVPRVQVPVPTESEEQRRTIDRLERRLVRLASALQSQESLLLELRQAPVENGGLASRFRTVQGLRGGELGFGRKKELMEQIFQSNLELRERITLSRDRVE
ncbi:MAG: hypothetical protein KDB61_02625 [Planctomycetes bacterium]|nr:hypothetical protein [Planctomycetota bacterium]